MKIHRYYTPDLKLEHDFWVHDGNLLHQWLNVLRYREGQEIILFDGAAHDRLYKVTAASKNGVHLEHVTDFAPKKPAIEVCLFWSMLKKDKNEFVLQKCTELGVSHFIPLLSERADVKALTHNKQERWQKIIIEAAEQCGRSDIPSIREPMKIETVFSNYDVPLYVCDQKDGNSNPHTPDRLGLLVGPEGGWSDHEKEVFAEKGLQHLHLSQFTLRAETAAIAAASMVQ